MKSQVLIAEGHSLLRQGLRTLISALPDFEVVGDCDSGEQAVRLALSLSPALVLMDLSMPGMNGIEASAQIRRRLPQARIALLTTERTSEYVRAALRAGVDGYILKDASYDELVAALRSLSAGGKFLSPGVSSSEVDGHANASGSKTVPWNQLTARERSVWKLIAEGHTNRGAAQLLAVSPKTVEKHRANLMRKLGLRNVAELMLIARSCGLLDPLGNAREMPRDCSPFAAPTSAS